MKGIGGFLKGGKGAGTAADAALRGRAIAAAAAKMPAMFPKGTGIDDLGLEKTGAKAAIWRRRGRFRSRRADSPGAGDGVRRRRGDGREGQDRGRDGRPGQEGARRLATASSARNTRISRRADPRRWAPRGGSPFGPPRRFPWRQRRPVPGVRPAAGDDIARGRYLAAAGGCLACHTDSKANGPPYAGGAALKTPFGAFFAPNITPHPAHGIGGWSEADFARAMRLGVAPDGSHYFPVFPYTSFTGGERCRSGGALRLSDESRAGRSGQSAARGALPVRLAVPADFLEMAVLRARAVPRGSGPVGGMEPRRLSGAGARPLRRMPHAAQRAGGAGPRSVARRRVGRDPRARRRPTSRPTTRPVLAVGARTIWRPIWASAWTRKATSRAR